MTCGNACKAFTVSAIAARKAGSFTVSVFDCSEHHLALLLDALAVLVDGEAGVRDDPVGGAGLADVGVVLVDLLRADLHADEDGQDDEGEPAEDGGLPVASRSSGPSGPRSSSNASGVTCELSSQLCGCRSVDSRQRVAEAHAPAGCKRERVVEGRERVGAGDVELELLVAASSRRP